MYQFTLMFSIFWEIALDFWPWLLLLAGSWLAGIALAMRQPRHFWRSALRMTAWLAAGVGVAVFLISPAVNRSSFANVSYWLDWANITGFASACVAAAFFWIWPWTVWACGHWKGNKNALCDASMA
jgi:hypothetical protein